MYQKHVLGLEEALAALNAMLQNAADEPARPIAVAITDESGQLLVYARMDGTALLPQTITTKKAYTAARMRSNTGAWAERLQTMGRSAIDFGDPNLIGVQGGVTIPGPDASTLGGIGVSGRRAEEDEDIALVGLAAMNL